MMARRSGQVTARVVSVKGEVARTPSDSVASGRGPRHFGTRFVRCILGMHQRSGKQVDRYLRAQCARRPLPIALQKWRREPSLQTTG